MAANSSVTGKGTVTAWGGVYKDTLPASQELNPFWKINLFKVGINSEVGNNRRIITMIVECALSRVCNNWSYA